MKIALLINPLSANGKAITVAKQIETILNQKNIAYTSFTDFSETLDNFTDAWIVGGDGTVNYFINKYPEIEIPLAVFKGGTGNDFAWNIYGDINIETQIDKVLSAIAKPVDAAICNERLFINGVGIGFDGDVLKSISTIRKIGGHLGYLLVVVKSIFRFQSPAYHLSINNKTEQRKLLLLQVFNSQRTGGGFMVSPLADVQDGRLNILYCNNLPWWKRLRYLPLIEKGKHLALPFIKHFTEEKINIKTDKTVYAQLDGELISGTEFSIKILKSRFLFKF